MNRNDMIELAQRRSAVDKRIKTKKAQRKEERKHPKMYLSLKEIAKNHNLKVDAARYILRNENPAHIPAFNNSKLKSYAFGYTQSQVDNAFNQLQKTGPNI